MEEGGGVEEPVRRMCSVKWARSKRREGGKKGGRGGNRVTRRRLEGDADGI